jgi:D-alanine-D-alanine ligase
VYVDRSGWEAEYEGRKYRVSLEDFSFIADGHTITIDLAHVYIHGNPGENGKLQAYFEMKQLPFVNSNALSSELSFDKWFCNQFLKNFDIKVADSILLLSADNVNPGEIIKQLGLPCFVKPADSGSSYGISKVYTHEELKPAITAAFMEGKTVVIESFMDGTEVTCGVYRNEAGLVALPCTEIISETDFFDYEAKYLGKSKEITPARISAELTATIQEQAKKIYSVLQLRSIARIDFIIIGHVPHVIEVNTTPGFSSESIVPKMLKTAGISITDFWTDIYAYETK